MTHLGQGHRDGTESRRRTRVPATFVLVVVLMLLHENFHLSLSSKSPSYVNSIDI